SVDNWRALVADLFALDDAGTRLDGEIAAWDAPRAILVADETAPIPRSVVPELRRVLSTGPTSLKEFTAEVDNVHKLLSQPVDPVAIVPVTVEVHPEVPSSPTWPRPWLNLLIAFIFGVIGSGVAVLFMAPVDKDAAA